MSDTELHPLEPFLPEGTRLLMLGSFPPARTRWCMEFFYPNFSNDMWRVMGLVSFGDRDRFTVPGQGRFSRERITAFLEERGIGVYDTVRVARRTRGTAADDALEAVEPTDIGALLGRVPGCVAVATMGMKATDMFSSMMGTPRLGIGGVAHFDFLGRRIAHYRMPSTSRAYPMRLELKAEYFRRMFHDLDLPINQTP